MDETRAIARLPHLDIEIVHRRLPEEQAEQLAISLKAMPSFDVLARHLAWQRLLQAAWEPWLGRPASASRPQRLYGTGGPPEGFAPEEPGAGQGASL